MRFEFRGYDYRPWWVFGLLTALPAAGLLVVGFWAVRAERIEREQQLRDQQAQVARLVDGALANLFTSLAGEAAHARPDDPPPALSDPDITVFTRDAEGNLVFWKDRIFVAEFGARPAGIPAPEEWPSAMLRMIEDAQAAEAQENFDDALRHYRHVGESVPGLRAWSTFSSARLRSRRDRTHTIEVPPEWGTALSPTGMPLFLIAAAEIDTVDFEQGVGVTATALGLLRAGSWWLSLDERRFYDRLLARRMGVAEDPRIIEVVGITEAATANPPRFESGASPILPLGPRTLLWVTSADDAGGVLGVTVGRTYLRQKLDSVLPPLVDDLPFEAVLRHVDGTILWGSELPGFSRTERLRTVPEWDVAFGRTIESGWMKLQRTVLYAFVAMLGLTLVLGLTMTARVVRRDLALRRLQGEFVAAVTHEFKSPITGIRLLMERLSAPRTLSPGQAEAYFDTIGKELDRLEWLINRILLSQQLQTGRKRYEFVPVSLSSVVESTAGLLRAQAESKAIDLAVKIEGDLPEMVLDRAAIADAVRNLIDNALKYSPPHSTVTVSLASHDGVATIAVQDKGVGVDAEELARVFEPFYRGRRSNEQDTRGTGLGLALVKAVVEGHGGTVRVVSTPDAGSCFSIDLPLNPPDSQHGEDSGRR